MTNFITPTETLLRRAKDEVSTGVVFFEGTQWFPSRHSLALPLLVSVSIPPVLTPRFHKASKRQTRTKATHFFKSVLHRHLQRPQCLTQAIVTHTHSCKSRTLLEPVIIKRPKTRDHASCFHESNPINMFNVTKSLSVLVFIQYSVSVTVRLWYFSSSLGRFFGEGWLSDYSPCCSNRSPGKRRNVLSGKFTQLFNFCRRNLLWVDLNYRHLNGSCPWLYLFLISMFICLFF